jgi:hypothetical protein
MHRAHVRPYSFIISNMQSLTWWQWHLHPESKCAIRTHSVYSLCRGCFRSIGTFSSYCMQGSLTVCLMLNLTCQCECLLCYRQVSENLNALIWTKENITAWVVQGWFLVERRCCELPLIFPTVRGIGTPDMRTWKFHAAFHVSPTQHVHWLSRYTPTYLEIVLVSILFNIMTLLRQQAKRTARLVTNIDWMKSRLNLIAA